MKETNFTEFAQNVANFDENIEAAQAYIKENFNVESSFDKETMKFNIWTNNINETLQLVATKDYLTNTLDTSVITIEYGPIK